MTAPLAQLPQGFFARPFAHRGLHGPGRPENSREAIAAAVTAGFAIEIDVQLSQDGAAMVFHDYGLQRLMGVPGTVQTRTAQTLSQTPLLGGGTGAPTLTEALDIIAGKCPVVVEIKDQDGAMGPNVGQLETAVAAAMAHYPGPAAVMSFNPHSVAALASAAPDLPRGITTSAYDKEDWPTLPPQRRADLAQIPDFDRVGASFVSHDRKSLSDPVLTNLKDRAVPILTWTIRSPSEAAEALSVADQITFEGYLPS